MEIQVFRLSLIEGRHAEILISRYAEPHEIGGINANASRRSCSGSKWGVTMSDDFDGTEDAKAAIRAAVQYLLKESSASDRGDILREIVEIVSEARGLAPGGPPLNFQV